jgi:hypothetical protein
LTTHRALKPLSLKLLKIYLAYHKCALFYFVDDGWCRATVYGISLSSSVFGFIPFGRASNVLYLSAGLPRHALSPQVVGILMIFIPCIISGMT